MFSFLIFITFACFVHAIIPGKDLIGGNIISGGTGGLDLSNIGSILNGGGGNNQQLLSSLSGLLQQNSNGGALSLPQLGNVATQFLQGNNLKLDQLNVGTLTTLANQAGLSVPSNLNIGSLAQFVPAALGGLMGANPNPPNMPDIPPPNNPPFNPPSVAPLPPTDPPTLPPTQPPPPTLPPTQPPPAPTTANPYQPTTAAPIAQQPPPVNQAPPIVAPGGMLPNRNDPNNVVAEASVSGDDGEGGLSAAAWVGIAIVGVLCCVLLGVLAFCVVTKYQSQKVYHYEETARQAPSQAVRGEAYGVTPQFPGGFGTSSLPSRETSSLPPRAYGANTPAMPQRSAATQRDAFGHESMEFARGAPSSFDTGPIPNALNLQSSYATRDEATMAFDLPDVHLPLRNDGPAAQYGTSSGMFSAGAQTPVYGTQDSSFGPGQYACPYCAGKRYHYQSDLDQHMELRHGGL